MSTRALAWFAVLQVLPLLLAGCAKREDVTSALATSMATTGHEVTFRARVVENDLFCLTSDGSCTLRVRAGSHELTVYYVYGYGQPECPNHRIADVAARLAKGDQVEILGIVLQPDEISTCESEDYYIRKAP